MIQPSLKTFQEQHGALLDKSAEMNKADIPQVMAFVESVAKAGSITKDADQRSFLRSVIRYWTSFINDKTGEFPAIRLQPFDVSLKESEQLAVENHSSFPGAIPAIWNIPYPQNRFFTGRGELLTRLAAALKTGLEAAPSQPQAISGLGGIGKTQLAVEYAYQHRQDYQAVLWASANTRESLVAGYISIADLLGLPERKEKDQTLILKAVKTWLQTHHSWLLILDNADDLALAYEFVPTIFDGHILLTTRAQAIGTRADYIEVETMPPEVGTLFLLRRAKFIAPDAQLTDAAPSDVITAREIVEELGGLPLAIDQAGAYIEETQSSLINYQQHYHKQQDKLLERRGIQATAHPEAVATTWSLSFEKVEQWNLAATDLLRVCAFLASYAIPEEIIIKGAKYLGPQLKHLAEDPTILDEAIAVLGAYSLLRRHTEERTLAIHRLVQIVLKDTMDEQTQYMWIERAILAVNETFPDVNFTTWPLCERCLPHALVCADLIKQKHITLPEASRLLNQAGEYLYGRARYAEAESLCEQALAIREQTLGPEHPDTATSLNNLARFYHAQGRYTEAEPLYVRALSIREKALGPEHPNTATSLNNLAKLYQAQGKYTEAEPLYKRALAIDEKAYGPAYSNIATDLNGLARLYWDQGRYAEAEPLYVRALSIREQTLGPEHPNTATSLNNLASLYSDQGKYVEAEPLYVRALSIREQTLGAEHPDTAASLHNLALLYDAQGKYTEAEPLYKRALAIDEKVYGPEHPNIATDLNGLAGLYWDLGRYTEVEPLYKRALSIREEQLGATHPSTATSLNNLTNLYNDQGKYAEAEPLLVRALSIREEQLGAMHPDTATSLNNLAQLYD
ncbi:MAG TPA: FxSxx-COOH system tetratricopeptide repeat protein, partial [Ktedonobacteraceae bacterium]|nr:FxSxx-COOH system tetratricopeptide repeat protein [Ktedonobacteraceae bacterium]